ncbi:hypothetical protein [Polyangium fumosum]|uniref:Uncharacterized protein n=1 Tax=Polyangium fumosum TaxID=889272 RepID=A0A4U1JDW0_9BACT|nr:hypothetical protein [Polyangium fumosum]TKD09152.1 hypothetical protein E8A74_12765 [Polyangium fumosum]
MGKRFEYVVRLSVVVVSVVASGLSGCKSEADHQREQAAFALEVAREQERLRAEEEKRRADAEKEAIQQAKLRILRDPSSVLVADNLGYFDKGIINSYRQLVKMSVLNKSKYALGSIEGEVDWLDDNGHKVGSVPFTLKGSIPAGDTKWFSKDAGTLSNGTLQTNATRTRIRFTRVQLIEE